jgi:group I intron endonuclease
MNGGIYAIWCNAYVYIGSAKCFEKRWETHLKDLRSSKHHNTILQRLYHKYGESSLNFQIVELVEYDKDVILSAEQKWIDAMRAQNICINIADASFGDNLTHHPQRELIIEKIRTGVKQSIESLTVEERKKKFGSAGDKNGMFGKTHTAETKQRMREREYSLETREKMSKSAIAKFDKNPELRAHLSNIASGRIGEKNAFYGKTHTDAAKARMGEKNRGRTPVNAKKVKADGVIYESACKCAEALGISTASVAYRIKSPNFDFEHV